VISALLIAKNRDAEKRITALLPAEDYRISSRSSVEDTRAALKANIFDISIFCVDDSIKNALEEIALIKGLSPGTPLAVAVESCPPAWEESALSKGVDYVFHEPLVATHFRSVIDRLVRLGEAATPPAVIRTPPPSRPETGLSRTALEVLRDFSHVLGYSLDYKLFTQHFVLKLREIIRVNRIAIFLEPPPMSSMTASSEGTRLPCISSVGIPLDIRDCFELSRNAGIGERLSKANHILRAGVDDSQFFGGLSPKIQREFEILGSHIAIPISDRERTLGVAVLGDRVTGTDFSDDELQLLFLLMEELGLAIKNSWLHHQLSANHKLFSDVLSSMSSGSMVVGRDLTILHANRAMLSFVRGDQDTKKPLEFADLQSALATPIYDVVEKGANPEPFFYTDGPDDNSIFRVSIIPFRNGDNRLPQSVMVVVEDFTQIEAAKRYDIESSKTKLISLIAKRFAHEIRNSLVPLTTHQQLLDQEYANEDFRRSLKQALETETGRIQRFTDQMLFLAQPSLSLTDLAELPVLIDESFQAVRTQFGGRPTLEIKCEIENPVVRCDRHSLSHAVGEVLANAIQANTEDPVVNVSVRNGVEDKIALEFSDNGVGFTNETAGRALEPFFTTRNTGVGLGLTVASRIIDEHHGQLVVRPRSRQNAADVAILLPHADG
jgi:nitrogen-specific signal transduction histidine kinase